MTQHGLILTATEAAKKAVILLEGILPSEELHLEGYTDVHEALHCLRIANAACQTLERWRVGCPPPPDEVGVPRRFWEG